MSSNLDMMRVCIFSVISSKFDAWETEDPNCTFEEFANRFGYAIPDQECDNSHFELHIDANTFLYISKYGILVLAEILDLNINLTPADILEWKEKKKCENIQDTNSTPHLILKNYNEFYGSLNHQKTILPNKIHYTLASYLPVSKSFDHKDIQRNCLWLLLKSEPEESDIKSTLKETMSNKKSEYIAINENNVFSAIWGARMILSKDSNRKILIDYIRIEATTQSLWLLVSTMNNYIDKNITLEKSKSIQLFEIIDKVYDVMFYEAEFEHVNAKNSHRYQLEIQDCLKKISNLGSMVDFFKKKAKLLEHKISMLAEKEEKEANDSLNFILNILTIVSSISAVFQIVDYWTNSPETREPSLWALLTVFLPLLVVILVNTFVRKWHK